MYEMWSKFRLVKHNGLPLYVGDRLISKYSIVWWWPPNWVWLAYAIPFGLYDYFKGKRN